MTRVKVVAPALGAFLAACTFGAVHANVGCAKTASHTAEIDAASDVNVTDVKQLDVPYTVPKGATTCMTTFAVHVYVAGSYTNSMTTDASGLSLSEPALVIGYEYKDARGSRDNIRARMLRTLAKPYFASEFTISDLCSAIEVSPTRLNIACIDHDGNLLSVWLRIRDNRIIEMSWDDEHWSEYGPDEPIPKEACVILETPLKTKDLTELHKSFLNDEPSERCRNSTEPRRKVAATFVHTPLPLGHKYYEWGKRRRKTIPPHGFCRSVTIPRLVLPPTIAASQDLGTLFAQCGAEPSHANKLEKPNGGEASVFEGGKVGAYQLGDYLYVLESERVRRVPLPCNVQLDFKLNNFFNPVGGYP